MIKIYLTIILIITFEHFTLAQIQNYNYERSTDTWNIKIEAPKDSLYIMKFIIINEQYIYPVKAFYRGSFMSKIIFPNNKSIEIRNCFLWFYLKIDTIKNKKY